jgi:hypothetical protein
VDWEAWPASTALAALQRRLGGTTDLTRNETGQTGSQRNDRLPEVVPPVRRSAVGILGQRRSRGHCMNEHGVEGIFAGLSLGQKN